MKRFFLICTLFLCLFFLNAAETNMTLDVSDTSKTLVSTISDDKVKMLVSLGQTEDGLIIKAPPVFSGTFNDWYFGEIKSSGLMNQIVEPSEKVFDIRGVKQFQNISTPALIPTYAGFAKSFKNTDFAALSPVLSPTSPWGLFFDIHKGGLYAGSMFLNYPGKEITEYLPVWQNVYKSGVSAYCILGYSDQLKADNRHIKISVFNQLVFRETYGVTGMLGWNLEGDFGNYGISTSRRITSNGKNLPKDKICFSLKLSNITVGYDRYMFRKPLYGGEGQVQKVEFKTGYSGERLNIEVDHITQGQSKTDKESLTSYQLEYKTQFFEMGFSIKINRSYGAEITVRQLDVYSKTGNCKFCIENAKYRIQLQLNDDLHLDNQVVHLNLSISSDHEYILSCKLSL